MAAESALSAAWVVRNECRVPHEADLPGFIDDSLLENGTERIR